MQTIQSIIVFTGGSAGDLLKALCLQSEDYHTVSVAGRIDLKTEYFKDAAEWVYNQKITVDQIDYSQLTPVDNCHHYMEFFHSIAENVYFIDYPDRCAKPILNIYIEKREFSDPANFLANHSYSIPEGLRKRVTADNVLDVFEIVWIKNLNSWRNNPQMQAVELKDFFDRAKLKTIVERISNHPIRDHALFDQTHQTWMDQNTKLRQLFSDS